MKTAALEGIVGLENNRITVPLSCPTGSCDFPPYSSWGYCSSCMDITSDVQEQHGPGYLDPVTATYLNNPETTTLNYTLPGEDCEIHFYVGLSSVCDLSRDLNCATTFLRICRPLDSSRNGNFTTLSLSWTNCSQQHNDNYAGGPGCDSHPEQLPSLGNSTGLLATNCTLGLCVKDYIGRVRNGVLDETLTSSHASTYVTNEYESNILRLPCIIDSETYTVRNISQVPRIGDRQFTVVDLDGQKVTVPQECVFEAGSIVSYAISEFLREELFPSQSWDHSGKKEATCEFHSRTNSSSCKSWYMEPMFRRGRFTTETISSDMDRLADAISNRLRAVGSNAYRNGSGVALGTVIQTTVCVRVDWLWLLLPVALVLLTAVLFVVVLFMARTFHDGQPLWKSSALVAFFHGIDVRFHTPVRANGETARLAASANETDHSPSSSSLLRDESHSDLMTLESMHARAKKVVVKLNTVGTGRPGFVMVNEEADDHIEASKLDGQGHLTDSHNDGETLLSTPLPRSSSHRGQDPRYLQVDLGIGLTPSIRSSLDRSTQYGSEGSPERAS